MSRKPIIRRRINLLQLPIEILDMITMKLQMIDVYSLRLTCHLLHNIVNTSVKEIVPHNQGCDAIISARSVLNLKRIEIIPLDHIIVITSLQDLLDISQHPRLRRFALDLTYLPSEGKYTYLDIFFTSFDRSKKYDISFICSKKIAFRLVRGKLILSGISDTIKDLLITLSSFTITSYRGKYSPEISVLTGLNSLEIVEPNELIGLDFLLTPNVKHLRFSYEIDSIGQSIFETNHFIDYLILENKTCPYVTYLGPIDVDRIYKINLAFPNLEVIELSLYSIKTSRFSGILSCQDELIKYREIIVDAEFYLHSRTEIIHLFPIHLRSKVRINPRM